MNALRLSVLHHADDVLRGRESHVGDGRAASRLVRLLAIVFVFGMLYGGVMGTFAFTPDRLLQVLYSAVKVPILLLTAFVLSLPAFFIINTFLGLRDDFANAMRALLAAQAGLTIVLASFAPLTVVWYLSIESYPAAILFNGLMFGAASVAAQIVLRAHYRELIARNPLHRPVLVAWLIVYSFVAIQMAWVLRPFIGSPGMPTTFFRQEAWGNAYVEVARQVMRLLGG